MKQENTIKDLSTSELRDRLTEEKNSYTKLKLNHAVSPIENPLKIRGLRKNIARIETELRTRKAAETQSTKA